MNICNKNKILFTCYFIISILLFILLFIIYFIIYPYFRNIYSNWMNFNNLFLDWKLDRIYYCAYKIFLKSSKIILLVLSNDT